MSSVSGKDIERMDNSGVTPVKTLNSSLAFFEARIIKGNFFL